MPAHEIPLPVGATSVKLVHNGREYPIESGVDTFTRSSEDGNIPIVVICGGCEMYGDIVEGWWKKGFDGEMDGGGGAQPFSAVLDNSGTLLLSGESDTPGTNADGWLNGHLPIPLMDSTEIVVSTSVPVDDTGSTAARDIEHHFYLRSGQKQVDDPQPNLFSGLLVQTNVDENGLLLYIYAKSGGGSYASIFSGSTYTNGSARTTGDIEAAIWRIVFHDGHPDEASPANDRHMHVYLKQADTIANAENAVENELSNSPFDTTYFGFDVAYPAIQIRSQSDVYFDSTTEAKVGYLRVTYPDFDVKYDVTPANRLLGGVSLYDGDPDNGGVKVYDIDHVFSGDPYIKNGLVQLWVDELVQYGMKFYYWNGAAYVAPLQQTPYMLNSADVLTCLYPEMLKFEKISPERVVVLIRMHDTASADSDVFFDIRVTILRGKMYMGVEIINMMQRGNYNVAIYDGTAGAFRFSYGQDNYLADDDVNPDALHNTTMSDNYMVGFDDEQEAVLVVISANEKPTSFSPDDGSLNMRTVSVRTVGSIAFCIGYIPFALIANLFEEAEDATSTGTNTVDAGASGGEVERLDAQGNYLTPAGEYVYYRIVAGTDLPEGRYKALWRAKDSNQIADDFRTYVYNQSDSKYRNEEGEKATHTLTGSFAEMNTFYGNVFEITAADVTGTDNIDVVCEKAEADANDIDVDYVVIIPLGDGEGLPQEVAHNAIRSINNERRLYDR